VAWVERQTSFIIHFDHPILGAQLLPMPAHHKAQRYVLSFEVDETRQLEARVALSTVDEEGARRNLQECAGRSFDELRQNARSQWNDLLGRIEIDGPRTQKRIFYTALYHSLIHPSDIADLDGRVRGPQGKVLQTRTGHFYSTLSLWDTFRAVHPLLTLIVPERVDDIVQSMLEHHAQQGFLPIWTAWGRETYCMIGNPALPVIADAISKGFKGFDPHEALKAMVETSTLPRPQAPPWAQRDWTLMDTYGYLPFDKEPHGEAVSKTLEHGYGDDAVARVAHALADLPTATRFGKRAQGYMHLWDPQTGVMRGRDSQGQWRAPFNPDTATSPLHNPGDYTEANAWQYTLTPALHDPEGLRALMGGPQGMGRWLDLYFSRPSKVNKHLGQEALIGQNAHGNEPSHHATWLYAFTSTPWKGHALVKRIARRYYRDSPDGLTGNDDCGQMSAWLVFATLGLYPVTPGQGRYVTGLPLVRQATIKRATGDLTVRTVLDKSFNRRRAHRVQLRVDQSLIPSPPFLSHQALSQARQLVFETVPVA
jgi:predicted alpha-1,2-mannosidase